METIKAIKTNTNNGIIAEETYKLVVQAQAALSDAYYRDNRLQKRAVRKTLALLEAIVQDVEVKDEDLDDPFI
jgi:hypothetical protein